MYTTKKFCVRNEKEVFEKIQSVKNSLSDTRKVFLADGNAFVLSYRRLNTILDKLNESFPKLNRVSAYALPNDIIS